MEFPAGNKVWPCDYKGTFYLVRCKGNVFTSTSNADGLDGRGCVSRHQSVGWTRTFPLLYCSSPHPPAGRVTPILWQKKKKNKYKNKNNITYTVATQVIL
ncbi:hypothetical protein AB205_0216220 [Aquarana catesbeiana]|uniref:Uncharacterized protein n=1 Tax=Aquarana catesbeiana TaxID=8400 RepID=A0A2G9RFE2_AQUCT|nr:hypothetical protein AB205_0216220 [Aquarana catesbeiana]